ncbi:aldolase catalytic domain-containing protein [Lachnospiraceae bacterium 47-T17]
MKNLKLLDCTLRDGGFVNEWYFGHSCINNIVERLEQAHIDIIEVGYLRDFVSYDKNSTQFPDTDAVNRTLNRKAYGKMLVALIDFGCCDIQCLGQKTQSVLHGIRLTFKKKDIDAAFEFGKEIQSKGYKLFLQPVAITDYTAKEVINLVEKINAIRPYAVCMVDTYGFMNKHDLIKYFYLFDTSLNNDICLGYHSHNNYQLSYANAIELMEQPSQREFIIDASVFGMGKGAGNLNTELIVSYYNENVEEKYDVNHILEIISTYLEKEREGHFWGYNLKYYLAAINDCHHQYVQFLLEKKTLTIRSINKILSSIDAERKTKYEREYIENLYDNYQNVFINDVATIAAFSRKIAGREILILAPGYSLVQNRHLIFKFIQEKNPYVISVNHYIEGYRQDCIFLSNGIRFCQLENEMEKIDIDSTEIIATSNISPTILKPNYVVNYKSLLLEHTQVKDNAALMLLRLLINAGVSEVAIAGFDGFVDDRPNYYDTGISLNNHLLSKNRDISIALYRIQSFISINFITKTLYAWEE